MAKRISPTQLTLSALRKRGFPCAVVEKFVKAPFMKGAGFRKDAFGFDILALTATHTIGVQAGVTSDHAGKVRKALEHPEVAQWAESPWRSFLVWTWQKKLVGKSGRWVPRISSIVKTETGLAATPFELS